MSLAPYSAFLERKLLTASDDGIEVQEDSPHLFPFQRAVVEWAARKGKAAVFLQTGLGKSRIQLRWAHHIPGPVLIFAPLAVTHQTVREAGRIDLDGVTYCRRQEDVCSKITVANYEMLEAFDPGYFAGVAIDESAILKSFTGKTKRALVERFIQTPYRLALTATPAPNDHMELGNHAQFLGVMESNEMLARWFINDSMQAGRYRLKQHGAADFWRWLASWGVCATLPSDLGDFDDEGFVLPPLVTQFHSVSDPDRAHERGKLFLGDGSVSATEMWRDKAETAPARCARAAELVATKPAVPWIIWCETNDEADRLKRLILDSIEVRGSESVDAKEAKLELFATGQARILVTKPSIAGHGLNFQHCADVVFCGLTYSFERFYQATRRTWRYGQTRPVTAHLVSAESDMGIIEALDRKRDDHEQMQREMVRATARYGLGVSLSRRQLMAVEQDTWTDENWTLHLGDCVEQLRRMPDESIDLAVYSPPFSTLYIYSDSIADMGNSANHAEFFEHLAWMVREQLRVTRPGRLTCVHCKDLPLYMNRDGAAGLYDFPGALVRCYEEAGWTFHSRVTIWKDPVTEMQRTKNHGLLHRNFTDRSEVVRQGMADYVLVFRAWKGEIPDKQIQRKVKASDGYIGEQGPAHWKDDRDYSIQVWQRYASPVWFDIQQPRILPYTGARSPEDEKHICALQLDVIDRCIWLWSNPGEVVLDPFAGIGSTGYCAIKLGRRFVGIELKRSYAETATRHLERACIEMRQGSLLDMLDSPD